MKVKENFKSQNEFKPTSIHFKAPETEFPAIKMHEMNYITSYRAHKVYFFIFGKKKNTGFPKFKIK